MTNFFSNQATEELCSFEHSFTEPTVIPPSKGAETQPQAPAATAVVHAAAATEAIAVVNAQCTASIDANNKDGIFIDDELTKAKVTQLPQPQLHLLPHQQQMLPEAAQMMLQILFALGQNVPNLNVANIQQQIIRPEDVIYGMNQQLQAENDVLFQKNHMFMQEVQEIQHQCRQTEEQINITYQKQQLLELDNLELEQQLRNLNLKIENMRRNNSTEVLLQKKGTVPCKHGKNCKRHAVGKCNFKH